MWGVVGAYSRLEGWWTDAWDHATTQPTKAVSHSIGILTADNPNV